MKYIFMFFLTISLFGYPVLKHKVDEIALNNLKKESNFFQVHKIEDNIKMIFLDLKTEGETFEKKANAFLEKYGNILNVKNISKLKIKNIINLKTRTIVKYAHFENNIEVLNSQIIVVFNKNGKISQITNSFNDLNIKQFPKFISKTQALKVIENKYNLSIIQAIDIDKKAELKIDLSENEYTYIYQIHLPKSFHENLYYNVNAETGEFMGVFNRVKFDVKGRIYPQSPEISTQTEEVILLDLDMDKFLNQNGDYYKKLYGKNVRSFNCLKNEPQTVNSPYGQMQICGVKMNSVATESENGDFLFDYNPSIETDDKFAPVQMYYHVNKAHNYFKNTFFEQFQNQQLMPELMAVVNFQYNPYTWMPFDNAFYTPAGGLEMFGLDIQDEAIVFGQGESVDYSYDLDVIYHEYTHGVVEHTSKLVNSMFDKFGLSVEPGSMNEGYADYFSSTITGDSVLGEYSLGESSRNLKNNLKCPNDIVGEVHYDGRFFSGTLWDIREELGSTDADLIIFNALISLSQRSSMNEARLATEFAAKEINENYEESVHNIFKNRGLVECNRAIPYFEEINMYFISGKNDYENGIYTKEYATGYSQFKVLIPAGKKAMKITFNSMSDQQSWDAEAPKISVLFKKGAPLNYQYSGGKLLHNGDYFLDIQESSGNATIQGNCFTEGEWYFQFLNYGGSGYFSKIKVDLLDEPNSNILYEDCEENLCSVNVPDGYCEGNKVCDNGECVDKCSSVYLDGYCVENKTCVNGQCINKCSETYPNGYCIDNLICIDNQCVSPCSDQNPTGYCSDEQQCINSVCIYLCSDEHLDGFCENNKKCSNGKCIKAATSSDGCSFSENNSEISGIILLLVLLLFIKKLSSIKTNK